MKTVFVPSCATLVWFALQDTRMKFVHRKDRIVHNNVKQLYFPEMHKLVGCFALCHGINNDIWYNVLENLVLFMQIRYDGIL